MKHLKHLIDFRFIFGMILIIAFMYVTNLENEMVHDHVTVSYSYANGFKSYHVIYCNTERVQVVFGKDHKETLKSIQYFNDN